MSKKKEHKKRKRNNKRKEVKSNTMNLKNDNNLTSELNPQKIMFMLYNCDKVFLKFVIDILNLPLNYEKCKLTKIYKDVNLSMSQYIFAIDNKYIIGVVVNGTDNYFIDEKKYERYVRLTKLYSDDMNKNNEEYIKFYLQLNTNDKRKNSKLEEFYIENDNFIIIKNLNKFNELYGKK